MSEGIPVILARLEGKIDAVNVKVDRVEIQTTLTNGRVTKLESLNTGARAVAHDRALRDKRWSTLQVVGVSVLGTGLMSLIVAVANHFLQ